MPPAVIAGIGAGSSILGGLLGGRPKTYTQQSTSTPTFSPELQQLMTQLQGYSSSSLANPMSTLDPMRAPALDKINRQYDVMPGQVATQMARRGYGSSGNMGNSMFKTQMARAGDVNNFEGLMAQLGAERQQQGASLGTTLLNLGRGQSTTGSYTGPSTVASDAFQSGGNALSDLSRLLMFQNVMNNQSGFQRYNKAPAFDPSSITPSGYPYGGPTLGPQYGGGPSMMPDYLRGTDYGGGWGYPGG